MGNSLWKFFLYIWPAYDCARRTFSTCISLLYPHRLLFTLAVLSQAAPVEAGRFVFFHDLATLYIDLPGHIFDVVPGGFGDCLNCPNSLQQIFALAPKIQKSLARIVDSGALSFRICADRFKRMHSRVDVALLRSL